jgi:hypothetical protein
MMKRFDMHLLSKTCTVGTLSLKDVSRPLVGPQSVPRRAVIPLLSVTDEPMEANTVYFNVFLELAHLLP